MDLPLRSKYKYYSNCVEYALFKQLTLYFVFGIIIDKCTRLLSGPREIILFLALENYQN